MYVLSLILLQFVENLTLTMFKFYFNTSKNVWINFVHVILRINNAQNIQQFCTKFIEIDGIHV